MRKVVFANDEIYHVFNRSVERRPIFNFKREYERAIVALDFYRILKPSLRLSKALVLKKEDRSQFFQKHRQKGKIVEIIAYCLMPNHFHLLLKQKAENGISKYLSDFTNSYSRYFNTRHKRIGPLFQGIFKAVHIETDEQLTHVSRYIHLNPVTSLIISKKELDFYSWSSLPEYLGETKKEICDKSIVADLFPSRKQYREFIHNQVEYAQKLEAIKHLVLENEGRE